MRRKNVRAGKSLPSPLPMRGNPSAANESPAGNVEGAALALGSRATAPARSFAATAGKDVMRDRAHANVVCSGSRRSKRR